MIDDSKISTLKYIKIRLIKLKIKMLNEVIKEIESKDYSYLDNLEYKKEYNRTRANYYYLTSKRNKDKEIRIKLGSF